MKDDRPTAGQHWSATGYSSNAGFVARLGEPLIELLAPQKGERILDLGCGDGALTEKLLGSGAQIVGCDASEDLLAAAKAKGLDVVLADGQDLPFENEFDAVFSNAALHWMLRPRDVIGGVKRALKPGGRFVGEFGGHGNVAAVVTALLAVLKQSGMNETFSLPWYFPTPEEYSGLLKSHGFSVEYIALIPRPTPLPTGMRGWLMTFGEYFLNKLPEKEREKALTDVETLLAPSLRDASGAWTADYVRLRFQAHLAN